MSTNTDIENLLKILQIKVEENEKRIEHLEKQNRIKDEKIKKLEEKLLNLGGNVHKSYNETGYMVEQVQERLENLEEVSEEQKKRTEVLEKSKEQIDSRCRVLARRYVEWHDESENKIGENRKGIEILKNHNATYNKVFEIIEKDINNLVKDVTAIAKIMNKKNIPKKATE